MASRPGPKIEFDDAPAVAIEFDDEPDGRDALPALPAYSPKIEFDDDEAALVAKRADEDAGRSMAGLYASSVWDELKTWTAGVPQAFAKGLASDVPGMLTAIPRISQRLTAGAVEWVFGEKAGDFVRDAYEYTPQMLASRWVDDNIVEPVAQYYMNGKLGELERATENRGILEMWRRGELMGWLSRGAAANAPQLALTVGTGGLGAAGSLTRAAVALAVPMMMEAGETARGLEEQEKRTGERIDDFRFGLVSLAKGVVAGAAERLGGEAVAGRLGKIVPKTWGAGIRLAADMAIEGPTEGFQTFVGNVAEDMALHPPESWEAYGARWLDPNFRADMAKDVTKSMLLGWAAAMPVSMVTHNWRGERVAETIAPIGADEKSVASRAQRRLFPGTIIEGLPRSDAETVKTHLRQQATNLSDEEFAAAWEVEQRQVDAIANLSTLDRSLLWGLRLTADPNDPNATTLNMFAGEKAGTANIAMLAVAKQLESNGATEHEIWISTGWAKGVDGKWRFEISDAGMQLDEAKIETLKAGGPANIVPITDVVKHDALGKAYPSLTSTSSSLLIAFDPDMKARDGAIGAYEDGVITVWSGSSPEEMRSTILHELQHAVQHIEGFARGGSDRTAWRAASPEQKKRIVADTEKKVAKKLEERKASLSTLREVRALEQKFSTELRQARAARFTYVATLRHGKSESLVDAARIKYLDAVVAMRKKASAAEQPAMRLLATKFMDPMALNEAEREARTGASVFEQQLLNLRKDEESQRRVVLDHGLLWDVYPYLAGETEARNTQKRDTLTERQKKYSAPSSTENVDRQDQIVVLRQTAGGSVLGSATVLPSGAYYLQMMQGHNLATVMHEMAHGWRQTFEFAIKHAPPERAARMRKDLAALEKWAGVKDGKWTWKAEEKWADACVEYLKSGRAPVAELSDLLAKFKQWLAAIYTSVSGRNLPKFRPEIERFFDTYVLDAPAAGTRHGAPPRVDPGKWRTEDRKAATMAARIRDLGPARELLVAQLGELEKLVEEAKRNADLVATVNDAEATGAEIDAGIEELQATYRTRHRDGVRVIARLMSFLPQFDKGGDFDYDRRTSAAEKTLSHMLDGKTDPETWLKQWLDMVKHRSDLPELREILAKDGVALLDAVRGAKWAAERGLASAEDRAAAKDVLLNGLAMRFEAESRFRVALRTIREIMGTAHPDLWREAHELDRLMKRFFAEPNLLVQFVETAKREIAQKSADFLAAEAEFRAVTRLIAARGMTPETWGLNADDLGPMDEVALKEIQQQVRDEVEAATLELEATDPTAIATHGAVLGINDTLDRLALDLSRALELPITDDGWTMPPEDVALFREERGALMEQKPDETLVRQKDAEAPPWVSLREALKEFIEALRDLGASVARGTFVLLPFGKPMRFFDQWYYDPKNPMNAFTTRVTWDLPDKSADEEDQRGVIGSRGPTLLTPAQRYTPYTAEEAAGVKKAFQTVDGAQNRFESLVVPALRSTFLSVLPRLEERQFVTTQRDFGNLDFAGLKRRVARHVFLSEQEYAEALAGYRDSRGQPNEARAEAKQKLDEAERRLNLAQIREARLRKHKDISGISQSPRVAHVLDSLAAAFDGMWQAAASQGLIGSNSFIEDFINRIYQQKHVPEVRRIFEESMPVDRRNPHSFKRTFDTLVEASLCGYAPASLDAAYLVEQYARSLQTSISKRRLILELSAVAPGAFRRFSPVQGKESQNTYREAEDGARHKVRYRPIDKFVSHSMQMAAGGKPGDVLHAEEHIAMLLENLYDDSAFGKHPLLKMVKQVNAWLKRIQLAIDMYHFFQVTRMAMAVGVHGGAHEFMSGSARRFLPIQMALDAVMSRDPSHPNYALVREFVEVGNLQLGSGDWSREGSRQYLEQAMAEFWGKLPAGNDQQSRARLAELYSHLGHNLEAFSRFLWNEYVPGLKIVIASTQLDRLQAMPKYRNHTREQLVKIAATFTNDLLGGSAWSLHGRSKTHEDMLKVSFLAPNWLETRFRNVLGMFKDGDRGGDLWREYWFGAPGGRIAQKFEAWRKNDPSIVEEGRLKWATGYVLQGTAFTLAMNTLIYTAFKAMSADDEEPDYIAPKDWLTSITFPTRDKRGLPLKISMFATSDYIAAFLADLNSISPLMRYYLGRQSPILRAGREVVQGKDYAGRALRPKALSIETLGLILDNSLPWFGNIFWGSATEPAFQEKWAYYIVRNASRMLGGHTSSTYPTQLMEELDFYVQQATQWNRHTVRIVRRFSGGGGAVRLLHEDADGNLVMSEEVGPSPFGQLVKWWGQAHARHHNANVRALIVRLRRDPDLRRTLGRRLKAEADKKGTLMMAVP